MTEPDTAAADPVPIYGYGPDSETGQSRIQPGEVRWERVGAEVHLWCEVPGHKAGSAGADVFRALFGVRDQLEKHGWTLLVKGARRDVWHTTAEHPCGIDQAVLYPEFGKPPQDPVDVLLGEDNVDVLADTLEQMLYRQEWAGETPAGGATWSDLDRRRREARDAGRQEGA